MRHMRSMRSMRHAFSATIVGSLSVIALTPSPAHAQYLDPGSGSIIVQAVIAVVVGVSATIRLYWHRIAAFRQRRSKDRQEP